MSTDLTVKPIDVAKEFQDKMIDKLRKEIGECLPDDVFKLLFAKALDQLFFAERTIPHPHRSYDTTKAPSWFLEEVGKIATPLMRVKVEEFVTANKELISKTIEDFLDTNKLTILAVEVLTQSFSSSLRSMTQRLESMSH